MFVIDFILAFNAFPISISEGKEESNNNNNSYYYYISRSFVDIFSLYKYRFFYI